MTDSTTIDPSAELDFSGDGLQEQTLDWVIVNATVKASNDKLGVRWEAEFEPTDGIVVEGLMGNKVRDSGYLSHQSEDRARAVQIGRSIIKRLLNAALGVDAIDDMSDLIGATVNAHVKEDDSGFGRIGRYKKAVND